MAVVIGSIKIKDDKYEKLRCKECYPTTISETHTTTNNHILNTLMLAATSFVNYSATGALGGKLIFNYQVHVYSINLSGNETRELVVNNTNYKLNQLDEKTAVTLSGNNLIWITISEGPNDGYNVYDRHKRKVFDIKIGNSVMQVSDFIRGTQFSLVIDIGNKKL